MTENSIKHFETLWEEAEKLSGKIYGEVPTKEITERIWDTLKGYHEVEADAGGSKEIADSLRQKYIGHVVFLLTALSLRDNINVYAVLQECCLLNSVDHTKVELG
jgi:hypothetical protein